jgi:putative membrane protein
MVFVHAAEHAPDAASLWLVWNFSPTLVLGIAALAVLYFGAPRWLRRCSQHTEPVSPWQITAFVSGLVILVVALMSPIDALGDDYLFSAHMVQHMLIGVVAPPLLLLGIPGWMIEPVLRWLPLRQTLRVLAHPVPAFGLLNLDLWLWHAPALYDAALANEAIHIFEHTTFIVFGVIFWLPILSPTPLIPRISRPFAILYLFGGCQPMVALGALLTFATAPFYAAYVDAPRIWGMDALSDQQLGGLIMWLPTNIPYLVGLSVVFFKWVGAIDRREREAAGELDDDPSPAPPSVQPVAQQP